MAPRHILRELADLWVTLGKQGQDESGAGVLRACTLTLVVLAEASDDAAALGETIAALMPEHPARTIVVRLSGAGERALAERVYAQCWMPFGAAAADLLRTDRDHGFGCGAGRFAIGGAAAGGAGPPGDCVVQKRAPV